MIEWNKVIYDDCMNEKNGLPTLEDKSIDLCFSDPPWGVNIQNNVKKDGTYFKGGKKHIQQEWKVEYNDTVSEEWYLKWFTELKRVCKRIILVTGQKYLKFWFNQDPTGQLIIHTRNSTSFDNKIASWNHYTPYLYWGKFKHKLIGNVIDYTIPWGWLNSKERFYHPSPKGIDIPLQIFRKLKPENIIDPFAGSGSYLKAADILDIPWLGYELNPIYEHDIKMRFSKKKITEYF